MITLIEQLKEDLQNLFNSREDEFKTVLVKDEYEDMPTGKYPKITISEILNDEVMSRSTTEGERTTALGYQFTVFSRDMQDYTAKESVRQIISIIIDYLQPPEYNMQRIGAQAIMPYLSDKTVMMGVVRYNCVYDKDTNLIYKS